VALKAVMIEALLDQDQTVPYVWGLRMGWMMNFFKTKVMVEAIGASKPKRSMCVGFEHGVEDAKLLKQI